MFKNMTVAFGLLIVVAIVWIGLTLYFPSSSVDINPNAETYIKPLPKSFDTDVINSMTSRIEEKLLTSPESFRNLIGEE